MIFSRRVALGTLCSLLALAGCHQPSATDVVRERVQNAVEKNKDAIQDFGTLVTKNSKLTGNDAQGRPLWSLQFKLGQIHNESDANSNATRHGDLQNAHATLYRDGKPETTFSAQKIKFSDSPHGLLMTLSDGVQATTQPSALTNAKPNAKPDAKSSTRSATLPVQTLPVQMKTAQLQIDVGARHLSSDSLVTMTQGQTVVVAQKMTADTSLAVAHATNGVVATSPQGRITAQNAVWSWGKGRAQATGNVTISHNQTQLVGQTLDADSTGGRGALSGKNGVTATSPQGAAKADRVLYNWNAGRVSAVGGVTMQKEGSTLRASQIDSDDKLNAATASGEVVLTRGDATVRATHLQAFDKMTRVVATNGTTVQRPGETLNADNATVWLNEKRATANGNVSLTRADGTLTANRADYDSASAYATASGDVVIRHQGATLKADHAEYWTQSGRAIGTGNVSLLRRDVTVDANRVEAENVSDQNKTQIVATGDVHARANQGTIRGQRVTWNNRGAVATGDVTLQRSGNTLRGQRLETDAQFNSATLSGGVSGDLSSGGTFSGNAMHWVRVLDGRILPQNGRVTARGGVEMRRQGVVLRAPDLDASGDGKNVLMSGGVVATGKDGAEVRSQTARYDASRQTIVAQGDVWYKDAGGNRLHGTNLVARLVGNTFKDATLDNVRGKGHSQIFSGKTLFGD